jgi:hypothetical protein
MLEDISAPASPTASELEYKEDYSDDDSKYDTENEAVPEIAEREIATQVDMGEVIAFTYNEDDMEYETDHGRDMFDDGLSDDESVDSDASTNYEELTEPDIITRLIKVPTTAADNKTIAEDSVEEGSEYISSDEGDSDASEGVADSAPAAVEPDATMTEDVAASIPQRRSLSALLKQDKELSKLLESRDRTLWHLKSIQEQIRQLEAELPIAEACLAEDDKLCESKQYLNEADLEESGISSDLFDAYQNFCESLHPEYGLRDGFSIRCNTPHNGSYVQYDPEFQIFKDCVEMPYDKCNFRCEASLGAIVEFYPIKCPEGLNGEVTWGEQHVSRLLDATALPAVLTPLLARVIPARWRCCPERVRDRHGDACQLTGYEFYF